MQVKAKSNSVFAPVHKSKHRFVLMKGSAGSGKSVDTAQQYILRLMIEKGRNLLCVRKSEVTNRNSTFSELISAINRLALNKFWSYTTNPLSITCVNGNQVIFRGVNHEKEREKLKSITFSKGKLTDIWIEEATELRFDDINILNDRLRGDLPKNLFYQMKLTFNPVSSQHWIKEKFFDYKDPDVLTHHSTYLDNRFIDGDYTKTMLRRKELDPEGYRIYGLGEWGEVGGLILKNIEISDISQNLENYDVIRYGQDFGFNHANAVLEVACKDGDVFILREIYIKEKDTSEIIEIADSEKFHKNIIMWCDSAEPDRIKMWKTKGYRAKGVKKEKGSILAQIDWLKQRKIHIHHSCTNTIKEIQQWKWKKDDTTTDKYLDEPIEFQDDAMAALRYSIEDMRKTKTFEFV